MRINLSLNSIPTVSNFGDFILNNRSMVSKKVFADEFRNLKKQYIKINEADTFSRESDALIKRLVNEKELDFAGIVVSAMCKLNEKKPAILEHFAKIGYDISEQNGDYVHMIARLNDLRKIYMNRYDRLYDYIQVLYKQENCLQKLTQNYTDGADHFQTLTRRIAERETYEQMLGYIQTEIGKLTRNKHPHHALQKLISAQEIFTKRNNKQCLNYIQLLIQKIETTINKNSQNLC